MSLHGEATSSVLQEILTLYSLCTTLASSFLSLCPSSYNLLSAAILTAPVKLVFSSYNFVSKQVSNSTKCHYVKELGFESCLAVKPVVLSSPYTFPIWEYERISGLTTTTQCVSHGLLVSIDAIDAPAVGEIVS